MIKAVQTKPGQSTSSGEPPLIETIFFWATLGVILLFVIGVSYVIGSMFFRIKDEDTLREFCREEGLTFVPEGLSSPGARGVLGGFAVDLVYCWDKTLEIEIEVSPTNVDLEIALRFQKQPGERETGDLEFDRFFGFKTRRGDGLEQALLSEEFRQKCKALRGNLRSFSISNERVSMRSGAAVSNGEEFRGFIKEALELATIYERAQRALGSGACDEEVAVEGQVAW